MKNRKKRRINNKNDIWIKSIKYDNLLNESNYEVIEHPYIVKDVDDIEINRCINKLNFDRRKKHILTIGLFNRNKDKW